ncbi:MAG: endonuclease/exonuclease/phosphatase family protein [Flavobacteriales bacterium]
MIKTLRLIALALIVSVPSTAQMRMMSYNLLNFPDGNIAGRVDTLANIINYYQPRVLAIQELQNEAGLVQISTMMNSLGYGNFTHAPFVAMQSDPGNPYKLQQGLLYDTDMLTLKSQSQIITEVRDINHYKLYLNNPDLQNGADTVFIHFFVTHLKSSTGFNNQAARTEMIQAFQYFSNITLEENAAAIICGDFNLYTNTEQAYQLLVNPTSGIAMVDPFASYGNWTGSQFAHKEILTQSTRVNQFANDGAGGGIDDRFDFILYSESLSNASSPIQYVENSFYSLGNNGTCYNASITSCAAGNAVPIDVLNSIYYMSDHIPQVCEFSIDLSLGIASKFKDDNSITFSGSNLISANEIQFTVKNAQPGNCIIRIFDLNGKKIWSTNTYCATAPNTYSVSTSDLSSSTYVIVVVHPDNSISTTKFVVQK